MDIEKNWPIKKVSKEELTTTLQKLKARIRLLKPIDADVDVPLIMVPSDS